jgi:hypothetical protein
MRWFGRDDGSSSDLVQSGSAHDYLSDPAIAAFFSAREHEFYFRSLKSVDETRAFHDRLIAVLLSVLQLVDERSQPILDEILARAFHEEHPWSAGELTPATSVVGHVRSLEPRGVKLLGIDDDVDFEVLRKAYRAAALRVHPDRGGSTAEMGAVNRAYELLHSRLGERQAEGGLVFGSSLSVPTARDFVCSTVRLLFDISLDDWALDEASSWLEELTIEIAPPTTDNRRYRLSFSLSSDQLMDLTEPASKLCQRLIACDDRAGAERAIKVAREGLRKAQAHGLIYEPFVNAAQEVMEGKRKPRFVLNHPRQLDNALRLGAIDEKRYAANLARIDKRRGDRELDRIERTELLSSSTFIEHLPIDHSLSRKAAPGRLIPHPGWYEDRAETLAAEQQAEYLAAFGPDSTLEAVEKYAWVRLSSLIRSAAYFTSGESTCQRLRRRQSCSADCSHAAPSTQTASKNSFRGSRSLAGRRQEKPSKDGSSCLTRSQWRSAPSKSSSRWLRPRALRASSKRQRKFCRSPKADTESASSRDLGWGSTCAECSPLDAAPVVA